MTTSYNELHRLTDVARGHSEAWRTLAGIILGTALYVPLSWVLAWVLDPLLAALPVPALQAGSVRMLLLHLFSIGTMALAIGVVVHLFHARRMRSVLGGWPQLWCDAVRTFLAVAVLLAAVGALLQLVRPIAFSPGVPVDLWLGILPMSLIALVVQVFGEEVVFRGYLLQQLAARFSHPLAWMGVPSLLFGLAHFSVSDFGANAAVIALWAGVFGLALADLTARTGSIGAAFGVHLANNVMALLVVALPGSTAALALFQWPFSADSPEMVARILPAEFILIGLCWLTARIVLRR